MDKDFITTTLGSAALKTAANAVAAALDADVLFYSGNIQWGSCGSVIDKCRMRNRRTNVLLILVTSGGDVDSAFRIARCLQQKYAEFHIYVPGWCKSSGTLIACGAHKIHMGDRGEFGPMDIQISKKDEIWATSSILNVNAAVEALQKTARKMFFDLLYEIKDNNRAVTYRTAAQLAIDLTGKLLAPVASQIDPSEIGENTRYMDVTENYAERLNTVGKNFKGEDELQFLIQSYPDHGFVIDREEARELFRNVLDPTPEMEEIEKELKALAMEPIDDSPAARGAFEIRFLSDEPLRMAVVRAGAGGGP